MSLSQLSEEEQAQAISELQQFIRFETVSNCAVDNGAYDSCASWLLTKLLEVGIEAYILPESAPHKPVVIGTIKGTDPSLPSILLNSHVDVVPAMMEHWDVPPFAGIIQGERIYGRGTHDMKSVCIQYIVALRALKCAGFQPHRTIHLSFVPDEEIGGSGMLTLMDSAFFKSIKIGLALDEGLANEGDVYSVFYGERLPWWVKVHAAGSTGHGSRFIDCTAVEQLVGVVNKALEFRQDQKDTLFGRGKHAGCSHAVAKTLGDVTSLNVTMLRAGVQSNGADVLNVIPPVAEAAFDIRISPHKDPLEMRDMIDQWCQECTIDDGRLTWSFLENGSFQHATTSTDPSINPWWQVFAGYLENEQGIKIIPSVFPAATDSRFLRAMGVRAIGFSPIRRSPILLHEHNEYIDKSVFIEGCNVYIGLLKELAMQKQFPGFDATEF